LLGLRINNRYSVNALSKHLRHLEKAVSRLNSTEGVSSSKITDSNIVHKGVEGSLSLSVGVDLIVVLESKDGIGAQVSDIEETEVAVGDLIQNRGGENVVLDEFLEALVGSVLSGDNDHFRGSGEIVHRSGTQQVDESSGHSETNSVYLPQINLEKTEKPL